MHGTTRTTTLSPPRHGRRRTGTRRRRLAATMTGVLVASTSVVVTTSAAAAPDTLLSQGALTAASSSESGGLGPRFAVDGDRATRWASQPSDDQWIRVDLGEAHDLDRVVLDWEAAYGKDFTVQVSQDGRSWTTVATVVDGTGGTQSFDVDVTGRYVQVVGTERGTRYGYSLHELQVFGDGDAPDPENPPEWDDEVTHHEFQANCSFSHFLPDDPIVFPGQPGKSHLHTFVGNRVTDAFTVPEDLFENTGSTCTVPQDHSSYWFPAIEKNGVPIEPDIPLTIYYKSGIDDYTKVRPFPPGLRFVAGDMMATYDEFRTAPGAVEGWECGDISKSWDIPAHCPEGTELNIRYQAPSCWDGMHLSPDASAHMGHGTHMAYPVDGQCPMTHPIAVPMIEFKIAWPVSGDMSDVRLVSGSDQSWHYDFINGWEPEVLERLVEHCINGGLQCNPRGYDLYKPHRGTVLDENYQLVG
ncbi:F5/8 type C domain-containing protein [Cellulosimicrobium aquatile]|uniref:F5/8 type C domain-containing protein n=2 Tax=Cellulosimicrobium TaxID=157920 RepID=A0A1N6N808_9MICO|nr:F5/8 type C domain-containing protein [Cellulosimicrobium aquatile]